MIRVVRKGDWVIATDTTLGADNAVAVAAMLWFAEEQPAPHGPIELLFTVDEETGMTGAANLDTRLLSGRILFNLDSEEDWILCVGCAGGGNTNVLWKVQTQAVPPGWKGFRLEIDCLLGGHSGVEIHLGRLNANKLLAAILHTSRIRFMLSRINGGEKSNAIARDAQAIFFVPPSEHERVIPCIDSAARVLLDQYAGPDQRVQIRAFPSARRASMALAQRSSKALIDFLHRLPHGVLAMSKEFPDLVESSTNLAIVNGSMDRRSGGGRDIEILCSSRSSNGKELRGIMASLRKAARRVGAQARESDGYPGWKPNPKSHAVRIVRRAYRKLFGEEPKVNAIHAGLECGVLGKRIPGMDMVSFGPTIKNAHKPGECVSVKSVSKFCTILAGAIHAVTEL
jgi:dipeptidase D